MMGVFGFVLRLFPGALFGKWNVYCPAICDIKRLLELLYGHSGLDISTPKVRSMNGSGWQ